MLQCEGYRRCFYFGLNSRSPYGHTFDIVDKSSVYEDGSVSCLCKVGTDYVQIMCILHAVDRRL